MAPEDATAASIAEAAVSLLRREATAHKRTAQFHRDEAQRIMQARRKLIEQLLEVGIEVQIDEPEATSHGQRSNSGA